MENSADYSQFVSAAYIVAASSLTVLLGYVIMRYFSIKSKIKNEK